MKLTINLAAALLLAAMFIAQAPAAQASESRLAKDRAEMAEGRADMLKSLAAYRQDMVRVRADMAVALRETLRQMQQSRQ